MTDAQRDDFDASHVVQMFGEIGSRASQRFLATQITLESLNGETSMINLVINDWVDVQEGCYRYLAIDDGGAIKIKSSLLSTWLVRSLGWWTP